jgi:tetratricopeptide (TPR) repeat protein
VPNYRRAINILSNLLAEQPDRAEVQRTLVACYVNMGGIFAEDGRTQDAGDAFRKGVEISERLVDADPGEPVHQYYLLTSCIDLGGILDTSGRTREAQEVYRRAIAMSEPMLAAFPRSAELKEKFGDLLYNMGAAMLNDGRSAEAVRAFRRQAQIFDELLTEYVAANKHPTRPGRDDCANAHYGLGRALQAAGERRAAKDEFTRSLAFWKEIVADFAGVAEVYPRLGLAKTQLALAGLMDREQSEGHCAEALSALENLVPKSPNSPELRAVLAQARQARAGEPAAPGKLQAIFPHVEYEGTPAWNDTRPDQQSPDRSSRR